MDKKKVVYVSTEWYADTDMTILHHISQKYDVTWLLITNVIVQRLPLENVREYSRRNSITLKIFAGNYKYLDLRNVILYYRLYNFLRENDFDVIIMIGSNHLYRIPFDMLLGERSKILQGIHDVNFHSGINGAIVFWLSYKWMFWWRKHFFVYSVGQLNLIKEKFPQKSVDLVGMSMKDLGPSSKDLDSIDKGIKLLFFGRIDYYKGLDLLITAIEHLYAEGIENLHLSICGRGKYWEECLKKIKTEGLFKKDIRFIEISEIPDLMSSHHFLVLPYRDSTQSGPLMIATNYYLPIIAPRLDSFMSVYPESSAVYYEQGHLIEALKRVSKMSVLEYKNIKDSLSSIRERYSEKKIAENYYSMIDKVI